MILGTAILVASFPLDSRADECKGVLTQVTGGVVGLFGKKARKTVCRAMDGTSTTIKTTVPGWRQTEESAVKLWQKAMTEIRGEAGGPLLRDAIMASRQNAINSGVNPLPPNVIDALSGYYDRNHLMRLKFRIGQGNDLSLAANSFRFGDAAAITLWDVIVFRNGNDAQDLHLWAHEVAHTFQYGNDVLKFAKRYAKDHQAVEREAEHHAQLWQQRYDASAQSSGNSDGAYAAGSENDGWPDVNSDFSGNDIPPPGFGGSPDYPVGNLQQPVFQPRFIPVPPPINVMPPPSFGPPSVVIMPPPRFVSPPIMRPMPVFRPVLQPIGGNFAPRPFPPIVAGPISRPIY
jgi:hypothetical protein